MERFELQKRLKPIHAYLKNMYGNLNDNQILNMYMNGQKDDAITYMYIENIGLFMNVWYRNKQYQHLNEDVFESIVASCIANAIRDYNADMKDGQSKLANFCYVYVKNEVFRKSIMEYRYANAKNRNAYIEVSMDKQLTNNEGSIGAISEIIACKRNDYNEIEIKELFEKVIPLMTDKEKAVFDMRLLNYSQKEIGEKLDENQVQVCRIIKKYQKKFKKAVSA